MTGDVTSNLPTAMGVHASTGATGGFVRTLVTLIAAGIALAGCSNTPSPAASSTPAAVVSTSPSASASECGEIDRAFNRWSWTPAQSADFTPTALTGRMADGQDFAKIVKGYTDPDAMTLGLEIARYNEAIAEMNARYSNLIEGEANDLAGRIINEIDQVKFAHQSLTQKICH